MMKLTLVAALATLAAGSATAIAGDDRPPNTDERGSIEGVLNANGFSSWRKIERDDGAWEVEDARGADGRLYDLDIRDGSIVKREREYDRD